MTSKFTDAGLVLLESTTGAATGYPLDRSAITR